MKGLSIHPKHVVLENEKNAKVFIKNIDGETKVNGHGDCNFLNFIVFKTLCHHAESSFFMRIIEILSTGTNTYLKLTLQRHELTLSIKS